MLREGYNRLIIVRQPVTFVGNLIQSCVLKNLVSLIAFVLEAVPPR